MCINECNSVTFKESLYKSVCPNYPEVILVRSLWQKDFISPASVVVIHTATRGCLSGKCDMDHLNKRPLSFYCWGQSLQLLVIFVEIMIIKWFCMFVVRLAEWVFLKILTWAIVARYRRDLCDGNYTNFMTLLTMPAEINSYSYQGSACTWHAQSAGKMDWKRFKVRIQVTQYPQNLQGWELKWSFLGRHECLCPVQIKYFQSDGSYMSTGSFRGNSACIKNDIFAINTKLNYLKSNRIRESSWSELTELKGTVLQQQQHNNRTVRGI